MQVELVKSLIDHVMSEPNTEIREGIFWTFSRDYDEYTPILKHIFSDETIKEIKTEEFEVKRIKDLFLIIDCYGGKIFFSQEELGLFIHLWERSIEIEKTLPALDSIE